MKYQAEKCSVQLLLLHVEYLVRGRVQDSLQGNVPTFLGKMESDDGQGVFGASERFYAELTDRYREKTGGTGRQPV